MKFHVIVPAAGNGFRFGASTPKQYLRLNDKPVLQHTLDRLALGFPGATIHVALAREDHWYEDLIARDASVRALRCGGSTRAESVKNLLARLPDAQRGDWVVVHDAVRPCLEQSAAARLMAELEHHAVGGFLAVPVSDTLKRVGADDHVVNTEPRETFWRAQTPQMFRFHVLTAAFELAGAERATDEAHAVERLGLKPRVVPGSAANVKITYPEDLEIAAAILSSRGTV